MGRRSTRRSRTCSRARRRRRCARSSARSSQGEALGVSIGQHPARPRDGDAQAPAADGRGAGAEGADQDALPARLPDLPGHRDPAARPGRAPDLRLPERVLMASRRAAAAGLLGTGVCAVAVGAGPALADGPAALNMASGAGATVGRTTRRRRRRRRRKRLRLRPRLRRRRPSPPRSRRPPPRRHRRPRPHRA